MAKQRSTKRSKTAAGPGKGPTHSRSKGGETHQVVQGGGPQLTTNQGTPLSDNQNSLKQGQRGPTLLEDFALREKITHFDHERIPERIVHARGSGAHGYFQPYKSAAALTRAAFLQDPNKRTEVFARFSTVAGGAGSVDLPRDVRGFAVKFYTEEGNFDLVGNNIPVFFIQDALKFPDLIHAVKMEPDRGFPQAASAHDTFWDFVSLMPESMHMLMWVMSDRAIPRSLRMMEGFGIHTFRFVTATGKSSLVKFHWRPLLGSASVLWDEAVKISGADPDFHRRDLFEAIAAGNFPEFEFSVQVLDESDADGLDFDVLDPTKLIPEELFPLQPLGKMVLDRNPDNFFAETEQVAFHPGHVVPGIDFTNDPLLQGRLHSYTDTQLSRLGTPNFHELPVNRPRCPMRNFQRDGMVRMDVAHGRVAYEPNSLAPDGPREDPRAGFTTYPMAEAGAKVRERPESFADHYSQARLFYQSISEPEQRHLISAFAFELGKVETIAIRKRMLGHLKLVHRDLCKQVETELGMEDEAEAIQPARAPLDLTPSPALSLLKKGPKTLNTRRVGILVTDGTDAALFERVRKAITKEGATAVTIAQRIAGTRLSNDAIVAADQALVAAPSVLFDAVVLLPSAEGAKQLVDLAAAVNFVRDAFGHLKVLGYTKDCGALLAKASIEPDMGMIDLRGREGVAAFIEAASAGRVWVREPRVSRT
jgi:catalase